MINRDYPFKARSDKFSPRRPAKTIKYKQMVVSTWDRLDQDTIEKFYVRNEQFSKLFNPGEGADKLS